MKKSELEEMIRSTVRKECKLALYEALSELFPPASNKKVMRENTGKTPHYIQKQPKSQPTEIKKEYVKDPILNEILNETAKSTSTIERMKSMDSGQAMVESGISNQMLAESFASTMEEFTPSYSSSPPAPNIEQAFSDNPAMADLMSKISGNNRLKQIVDVSRAKSSGQLS